MDYVTNLNLDFSKDLLLDISLKIDEISTMMGYSTSQYFISRFKIKYSYTQRNIETNMQAPPDDDTRLYRYKKAVSIAF